MELNKCLFIGNLTRDPETRTTGTGKTVTSFTVAVNSRRSSQSGKDETLFVKVDTWNKTAEIAQQYLRKGSQVLVEGRLRMEEYTTREGEKRRDIALTADNIQLGARPREEGAGGGGGGSSYQDRAPREPYPPQQGGGGGRAREERRTDDYDRAPDRDYADGNAPAEDDLPF